jgi:Tfp pilus assembly protein PilF
VEALADLGFARFEEKRYDEATAYLQQAIALKPRFAEPHIQLGRVYAAEGKNDLAEAEFLQGLEIHPTNTEALNTLGEFYLRQGRLAEAATQFRSSVEIYSDLVPWSSLGEIYDRENQPEQAREAWEQVLTFERFNPHAHRSLGQIYLSHGQWALAQNEFQMCLLMDEKDSVALAGLEKIRTTSGIAANKKN